ncbi:hypothetical protein [uncultured Cohaesibacter sp.]|uniref:hypothetical protein n=1 Tax=uncultured Cohaesibacter sp. TaxID=1002546 RepID=UPI0029C89A7E|nr:hypothetical protein [uncultured Cohaesibacter sp.]
MSSRKPSRIKINLAIPAYGSNCHIQTAKSLMMTTGALVNSNIHVTFSDIDACDIVTSRNFLISNFYYRLTDCSHLLFIDSDMGFEPNLIGDMLNLRKDVVGVLYPKRSFSLEKFYILAKEGFEFEKAKAHSHEFLGRLASEQKQEGKFVSVDACGTGILLISRNAVAKMIEKCPDIIDRTYFKDQKKFGEMFDEFLTPFNRIVTDESELSEDYSFCYRWRNECDGEIWASFDHPVSHYGNFTYQGRIIDQN